MDIHQLLEDLESTLLPLWVALRLGANDKPTLPEMDLIGKKIAMLLHPDKNQIAQQTGNHEPFLGWYEKLEWSRTPAGKREMIRLEQTYGPFWNDEALPAETSANRQSQDQAGTELENHAHLAEAVSEHDMTSDSPQAEGEESEKGRKDSHIDSGPDAQSAEANGQLIAGELGVLVMACPCASNPRKTEQYVCLHCGAKKTSGSKLLVHVQGHVGYPSHVYQNSLTPAGKLKCKVPGCSWSAKSGVRIKGQVSEHTREERQLLGAAAQLHKKHFTEAHP